MHSADPSGKLLGRSVGGALDLRPAPSRDRSTNPQRLSGGGSPTPTAPPPSPARSRPAVGPSGRGRPRAPLTCHHRGTVRRPWVAAVELVGARWPRARAPTSPLWVPRRRRPRSQAKRRRAGRSGRRRGRRQPVCPVGRGEGGAPLVPLRANASVTLAAAATAAGADSSSRGGTPAGPGK